MSRIVPNLEGHYIYNYIVPEKEGVQVFRMPPDARGGDTYQVVADVEATPEECFDTLTDFELMQHTSSIIREIKVHKKDEEGAVLEMRLRPEIDSGIFFYRYAFDRKNTQMFSWMHDYKGPSKQWYAISVETRIYSFGKISRIILTETFLIGKGMPSKDATDLFTTVGYDMINRIKKRKVVRQDA